MPENLEVELPAGGTLTLKDTEEVRMWETAAKRYVDDYSLHKANDLMLLGAILSQSLTLYRAQRDLQDEEKSGKAQGQIIKASGEIRELEKALGIDKKSREAGGQHTVATYIENLKRAAHERGVRLSERVIEYEQFMMELRWKLRLLRNGDAEDRSHHGLSEAAVLNWASDQLDELEEKEKEWANTKGKVFVGRL